VFLNKNVDLDIM